MKDDCPFLFVYGTLRRKSRHPMARWLARNARPVGPAYAKGRLYDVGAYPAFVPSERPGERVRGDLFLLPEDAGAVLDVLDRYEGCGPSDKPPHEYRRCCLTVRLGGGRTVPAWTYCYQWSLDRLRRLRAGVYRAR